jgi:hypothetical protein
LFFTGAYMKKSVKGNILLFCAAVFALPFSLCAGGTKDTNTSSGTAAQPPQGGQPPDMNGTINGSMMGGGPGTPAGFEEKTAILTAVLETDGKNQANLEISGKTLQGIGPDQNVLLALNKGNLSVSKVILYKTGDSSDPDQSNFSGLNAVVVSESGSTVTLQDVTINSDAEGSNAIFSTGDGSVIQAKQITIHTKGNSSRGLDATYNGTITADTVDITTEGAHCAALATDRGEGTITVNGGTVRTSGEGSPVVYSTGIISASNLVGTADGSEIAVIEGKNAITLDTCHLSGYGDHGIMLYQSMSGDAGKGTSVLTVRNSDLHSYAKGPFFYVTNTRAKVYISNTKLTWPAEILIQASGNDGSRGWGKTGENGGTLEFTAEKQQLAGDVSCDETSSVQLLFRQDVSYTGAIDREKTGKVSINLDAQSVWTVTADSYIDVLQDADTTLANIHANGHTIYYDKNDTGNSWLKGKTLTLADGKLVPYAPKRRTAVSSNQKTGPQQNMGAPGTGPGQGGPMGGNGNPPQNGQLAFNGNPPPGGMNGQPPAPPSANGQAGQQPQMQKKTSCIPADAVHVSGELSVSGEGREAGIYLLASDGKRYTIQLSDPHVRLLSPQSIAGGLLDCTGVIKHATASAADDILMVYSYRITVLK